MIALHDGLRAFSGLHGGLVMAWLLEEAMGEERDGWATTALTTHFLAPVDPAVEASFEVETMRDGRSMSSCVVCLVQGGQRRAVGLVSSGPVDAGLWWGERTELSRLPAPESLARFRAPVGFVPVQEFFDLRPLTSIVPGSESDRPDYEMWLRIEPELSARLSPLGQVCVMLDAPPPGLLALWRDPRPVPTVELSAHFADRLPRPGAWVHVTHRTSWARGATCVDETEVRTRDGELVAQARQARRVL